MIWYGIRLYPTACFSAASQRVLRQNAIRSRNSRLTLFGSLSISKILKFRKSELDGWTGFQFKILSSAHKDAGTLKHKDTP